MLENISYDAFCKLTEGYRTYLKENNLQSDLTSLMYLTFLATKVDPKTIPNPAVPNPFYCCVRDCCCPDFVPKENK